MGQAPHSGPGTGVQSAVIGRMWRYPFPFPGVCRAVAGNRSAALAPRTRSASFGSRGVFAYDLDGALQWSKVLGSMKIKVGFGEGISPVLAGGFVLINWDHEGDSFIVALDAATGQEKWRQARDEKTTWTTPYIVEHAGKLQAIVNGTKKNGRPLTLSGAPVFGLMPSASR